jgi:hypothetical protein
MGLQERAVVGDASSPPEIERRNLFWLLYSVDKQRIFIRGSPCRLYLFECDITLPTEKSSVIAHLKLACLLEEVYKQLHSPQATRQEERSRDMRRGRLDSHLNSLSNEYHSLILEITTQSGQQRMLALQLQYAFNVTRLLIHSQSTDAKSKQIRLETAREVLKILEKLSRGSYIFNGGLPILERSDVRAQCLEPSADSSADSFATTLL